MRKRGKKARDLVSEIRHLAVGGRDRYLPSMAVLSHRYRADITAVSRAVAALRAEGLVDYRQGTRVRIVREGEPQRPFSGEATSAQKLADHLRARIVDGAYRIGDDLPKRGWFALENRVSTRTVTQALSIIEAENLVHRAGRSWRVGPGRTMPDGISPRSMPWIAVVQDTAGRWARLITERTGPFVRSFLEEASRCQVRIQPVVAAAGPKFRGADLHIDDLLAGARKNHLYRGCLVVGNQAQYESLDGVVDIAVRLPGPVVWFDQRSEGEQVRFRSSRVTQVGFSDAAMAAEAIRFLASWRHRQVAYVSYASGNWQRARERLLKEAGARTVPTVEVLSFFDMYDEFARTGPSRLHRRAVAMHRNGPAPARRLLEFCLRALTGAIDGRTYESPYHALVDFVLDWPGTKKVFPRILDNLREHLCFFLGDRVAERGPPSAFVGAADKATRGEYLALVSAGIAVPGDFSYLSFDSYLDPVSFPVSTVDNGSGWLGYASFHTILGDVPVKPRHGDGRLTARPRVDRRGSVGTPAFGVGPGEWTADW